MAPGNEGKLAISPDKTMAATLVSVGNFTANSNFRGSRERAEQSRLGVPTREPPGTQFDDQQFLSTTRSGMHFLAGARAEKRLLGSSCLRLCVIDFPRGDDAAASIVGRSCENCSNYCDREASALSSMNELRNLILYVYILF